jgi:hypothetical protein
MADACNNIALQYQQHNWQLLGMCGVMALCVSLQLLYVTVASGPLAYCLWMPGVQPCDGCCTAPAGPLPRH